MPSALDEAMTVCTLESLIARARLHAGIFGVAVWKLGSDAEPRFIASCVGNGATVICDPRGWHEKPTVDEALAELERAMNLKWGA